MNLADLISRKKTGREPAQSPPAKSASPPPPEATETAGATRSTFSFAERMKLGKDKPHTAKTEVPEEIFPRPAPVVPAEPPVVNLSESAASQLLVRATVVDPQPPVPESVPLPEAKPTPQPPESLFDAHPQGMYELAAQLGIPIPENKDAILRNAANCLRTVFREIADETAGVRMLWPTVKSIVSDIEELLTTDANIITELQRPRADAHDRLVWHSLYTAILAMELARQTPDLACSLQEIGGAALLHDIGMLVLPEFFGSFNQENSPVYQEHVLKGVKLAQAISAPPMVVTIISQHHEQLDGQGFPNHIKGDDFLIASQIVAVANVFEQAQISLITADEKASPVLMEIPMLFKQYRRVFDNDLLKKMINVVGFYPIGSLVELNNRSICEVVRQNPDTPLRPVVKLIIDGSGNHPEEEKIVDLKQTLMLSITRSIRHGNR